jgi:hypothetical protein
MKTTNKNLIFLLSLVVALNACEMKRNLDDMHDSTVEMNKTTKEMNETTGKMNERTEGLENATGELYDALRQGDSLSARRSALDNLIKTTEPARKLSEAAKYYMSFEFQFWTDHNQDKGEEKRLDLATVAAREFFKDIYQFIPNGVMKPDPFADQIISTEKGNLVACLNALSVTTHYLNPKQEAYLKAKPEMKSLSMYKIIEESLLAKASIESGDKKITDYPGYVFEVLSNEQAAVYLMQARYNYLSALFLGRTTPITHNKWTGVKFFAKKWNLDLRNFNAAQIEEFNMFLDGALKTKKILIGIGAKPQMDFMLARMINNMTLVDINQNKNTIAAKVSTFREIAARVTELKKF